MVNLTVSYFYDVRVNWYNVFGKQFGNNIESHLKRPVTWLQKPIPRNYTMQIVKKTEKSILKSMINFFLKKNQGETHK